MNIPVVVALPGLQLPPVFITPNAKWSPHAVQLEAALLSFAEELSARGVTLVHRQTLDVLSPPGTRHDLKSELFTGFPYTKQHAEALGSLLADCIANRNVPKKGIITDLDDTVWNGILGEVGPQAVSWDLQTHSQIHGLYQQLLASLAEQGVLLGVASKNDATLVRHVFGDRRDLIFPADRAFPLEVNWGPKSESVMRILRTWNIGPDSVIFIDDSPLELAEVKAVHPEIECVLFPKHDYQAAAGLFSRLRDLFGKDTVSADDRIRIDSIRHAGEFERGVSSEDQQEEFLAKLDAVITFTLQPSASETRVLELVNKTNQFNLNGLRYSEAEWQRMCEQPGSVVVSVGYRDQFGPLGTIAVLAGTKNGPEFRLHTWVMSCRAFSRRIEYRTLQFIYESFAADRIVFEFQATGRNGPLRQCFVPFLGAAPASVLTLEKSVFQRLCPPLSQAVEVQDSVGQSS